MIPKVKDLYSVEHLDLSTYKPESRAFIVGVELVVGDQGQEGGTNFALAVVSPSFLEAQLTSNEPFVGKKDGMIAGRHLLIVSEWNYAKLVRWIEETVASCADEVEERALEKLARYFYWEFEDFS